MRPVGVSYKSPAHKKAAIAYYDRHKEKLRAKSRDWYYRNRERAIARRKQWALDNPEAMARHNQKSKDERLALKCHLKKKYGLTIEQRDAMFAKNGGLCWICKDRVSDSVDHDHATGLVRGALCRQCNFGLGAFSDDSDKLTSAILYLKAGGKLYGE